jgi:hypothetical protein
MSMRFRWACALAIAEAISLCGCANQRTTVHAQPESETQYVGWVRFVGDFLLYTDRSAFKLSQREHCVSGALPLEKQRDAARNLSGKRVRVIAKRVLWKLPDPLAVALNNNGSPITNWCGGEYVLFATDMEVE